MEKELIEFRGGQATLFSWVSFGKKKSILRVSCVPKKQTLFCLEIIIIQSFFNEKKGRPKQKQNKKLDTDYAEHSYTDK